MNVLVFIDYIYCILFISLDIKFIIEIFRVIWSIVEGKLVVFMENKVVKFFFVYYLWVYKYKVVVERWLFKEVLILGRIVLGSVKIKF